jgi:hypothetical protein
MSPAVNLKRPRVNLGGNSGVNFALRMAIASVLVMAGAVHPTPAQAQAQAAPVVIAVSDTVMEIRLTEGSIIYGRIVAIDGDRVTIEMQSGTRIEVNRPQILSVRRTSSRMVRGERWEDDPNATRLFFAPTGRSLGQGTGYFAVYELMMPFLSYGLTDRISVSGGTPVIPGLTGELFYFAPKVTVVSASGVDLAAGAIAFAVPSEDESLGLLYGVGTFGSKDNAVTLGIGVPFVVGDESDLANRAVVMLGFEARTTRRTKFIGESYFVPGVSGGLAAFGLRFFGERLSADAGLGFIIGDDTGCCVPIVNFVYVFGKQR